MPKLFEDDDHDEEIEINTNKEYATAYNTWRQKEELNKLKTKYGEHIKLDESDNSGEDDSSSSDDDDEEVTKEIEKDFFKTLSCLKNKDPRIYDENVVFFKEDVEPVKKEKKKKDEPIFMKDYERKIILEKEGKFDESDEEELEDPRSGSPTYVEEQRRLKESFKKILEDDNEENREWGGLFQKRMKSKEEQQKEEEDYKVWLKGQKDDLEDKVTESELKPLKEFWTDPKLDTGEAFLRDYLLNKRYLEKEDESHIPTYEEIIHDSDEGLSADEEAIDKQEEFELKYNFRFEEPDQEFIKRYPRTMENTLRRKDDRRKIKREELKKRKEEDKKQKQEELKQLKVLKRKEIQEKIEKLKEITGNDDMIFQDGDLEDDFDPETYDKRMQQLFDEKYYDGTEGEQKPEFPDLDSELGPWRDDEPHCEDDDFIMDCDYNPNAAKKLKEDKKKKRIRPGKAKKELEEFDENDEKYKEYMDELYKLDYEDMIGDIPCRFKYREVVPNDFGLTIEEILLANDKELNRWCSLKKAVQHRPEYMEKYDVRAYKIKGANEALKYKLLPSLYAEIDEEKFKSKPAKTVLTRDEEPNSFDEDAQAEEPVQTNEVKRNKKETILENDTNSEIIDAPKNISKKKKKVPKLENDTSPEISVVTENVSKKKKKRKNTEESTSPAKKSKKNIQEEGKRQNVNGETVEKRENKAKQINKQLSRRQKKNKKKVKPQDTKDSQLSTNTTPKRKRKRMNSKGGQNIENAKKSKLHNKQSKNNDGVVNKDGVKMSDARLAAYGINPKKFKNKLKYKK